VGWGSHLDPYPSLAWGSIGVGFRVGWGGVRESIGAPAKTNFLAPQLRRISNNYSNNPSLLGAYIATATLIDTRIYSYYYPYRYAYS